MHIALVGQPAIALDALLVVAKELWGHSLAERVDMRHAPAGEVEKFLICLAGFQSGRPEDHVPQHLLAIVHVSWFVVADSEVLSSALNWLPRAERVVVPTERRAFSAAWLVTRLDEVREAIDARQHYPADERQLFAAMRGELERHGLLFATVASPPVSGQKLLR